MTDILSVLLFILSAAFVPGGIANAQDIAIYHSPDDSGINFGTATIASSGTTTLHLYMDGGSIPSTGTSPCCAGQGDEILGWDLGLAATGGFTITSVNPVGEAVINKAEASISMNGGDFRHGDLGPTKIADIDVSVDGDGALVLASGQVVGPSLTLRRLDMDTIVYVPEPASALLFTIGTLGLAGLAQNSNRPQHSRTTSPRSPSIRFQNHRRASGQEAPNRTESQKRILQNARSATFGNLRKIR